MTPTRRTTAEEPATETLLTVSMETKTSRVQCFADAALLHRLPSYTHTERVGLYAMSIIGPEQAIRAIAAGCSLQPEHQRRTLTFTSPSVRDGQSVRLRRRLNAVWSGPWNAQAQGLTDGAMHLVALPAPPARGLAGKNQDVDEAAVVTTHVIIAPPTPTAPGLGIDSLQTAIYERCCDFYTTPLIPLDQPGQTPAEREAGRAWCKRLTAALMDEAQCWQTLIGHPEQPDRTWHRAGLLRLSQRKLDQIVSRLVADGDLAIPELVA